MGKFEEARELFRGEVQRLKDSQSLLSKLKEGQKGLAKDDSDIVVYNTDLDKINPEQIKLIIVADNPGKKEQAEQRYLIGSAGTRVRNFFSDHPIFSKDGKSRIEFRSKDGDGDIKDVLVLNKTPIHTPKTDGLYELAKHCKIKTALDDSQEKMAELLVKFHEALHVPVWIVGAGEKNMTKIFKTFVDALKTRYAKKPELLEDVFIFYHFSYGWFDRDIKTLVKPLKQEDLLKIGRAKRKKYLG